MRDSLQLAGPAADSATGSRGGGEPDSSVSESVSVSVSDETETAHLVRGQV